MSENPKKLFLLDAYALIFRAYFAFISNPRVTSKGLDTSAIFGFITTLLEVLEKQKPSHIAVIYDYPGPTFRHEKFEAYKAQRDETPEGIKLAVPYIQKLMEAFRIPFLGVEGFEADDVIGTLAKQAEKEGFEVFMMTPDKDFGQLVSENIKMYRPARAGNGAEIWGVEEIKAKFDIDDVDQVVDYLGMMGDSADNIPGFPGVGPKTASKLLKQYGSMENMLEHADEIKGKLGEKIRDNAEQGIMSKMLARIICDVPIQFDAEVYIKEDPDTEKISEIFQELEFRTLLKRVTGEVVPKAAAAPSAAPDGQTDLFGAVEEMVEAAPSGEYQTIENSDHLYQLVEHPRERKMLLENLMKQPSVCFDTETTSLETAEADLVGVAFSYTPGIAYYVAVPEGQGTEIMAEFKPFFEREDVEIIGQNLKYDISILKNFGVEVRGRLFDTMLAHYLINADMRHNMDVLAETYLHYKPVSIETLIGKKGKKQGNMRDVDPKLVKEYAGEDADITFRLKQIFEPKLKEGNATKVFDEIELPLVPVLSDMELQGVNLDTEALSKLSKKLEEDIAELSKEIIELAGEEFNIASPKQLGEILFGKLKLLEKPKKTKSGQYATSEDILSDLAKEHRIAEAILDYRQMVKLKSTYVDALPEMVNSKTKRIHTSYNQAVAATGRLSSVNPNLQNIPIRTERGREVRKAFIPRDENHLMLAADYSQIELRLIAELSGDKNMMDAFLNEEDIHTATAAKVFGVNLDEVTREQRSNAKTVNFGIIYGVSAFGLSQQTTLSRGEAGDIIKSYFQTYPGIQDYIESQKEFARKNGFVETLLGRRRYLKDINSRNAVVRSHAERNAVNAPIQGTAADIIKLAMIKIYDDLKPFDTKMVLQVHDELVFDAPAGEIETLKPIIKSAMENAVDLKVPLTVEFGHGKNWLEAH
ncbi:DNA polymerase I [Owenweeksia hongkongensis DSM 17368]|uniref:DNA polymerase I n=1 Tax=Owenweeksia hongkongensis (strain DSM 17368 / CIP 108786 / JCM 12287 / NRRL B-23963 / UST20020801) TaxID=926562 RepID=G8R2X9_OWEHD|nr:DNA polymerase I [Owenweeksia hongkongensis]AEV32973.1 DNA polymerase I [Owenweeksia hongkongensis DSM 17368]